jgi:hypothetical protein
MTDQITLRPLRTTRGAPPSATTPSGSSSLLMGRAPGVRQGAVNRAIHGLSLGVVRSLNKEEQRRKNMGLGEVDLQYQVDVNGEAGTLVDWSFVQLDFQFAFYYSAYSRDSDLDRPQFTQGATIDSGTPVVINACVVDWALDPEVQGVTGATMAIGAFSPGASEAVPFNGSVHLVFQGYSGVIENESDL